MRDEDQRPLVRAECPLQLLDRRQVEVVRRLVEDEAAGSARSLNRELRTRPLARREASGRPEDVARVEVELRQQRPRLAFEQPGRRAERVEQRLVGGEESPRLADLAEDDGRPDAPVPGDERQPSEQARRGASSCRCRSGRRSRPALPSRR